MSKTDDTANSKPAFLDFLRPKRESVTEDEIKDMVAENIELLEDEKRMINDILDLADMTVREIMKPRVDMIMAEDTEPARAALDRMRGTGYSRLPVYHEEVDEVSCPTKTSSALCWTAALKTRWPSSCTSRFTCPRRKTC